jgi:hypothetical protein
MLWPALIFPVTWLGPLENDTLPLVSCELQQKPNEQFYLNKIRFILLAIFALIGCIFK